MTGNNPAPISEAELAQLLADHQATLLANQRQNAQAADLRQRQRAEALGLRLDLGQKKGRQFNRP
jgi:cytosine/adenosine deaminase-related metal-dependent hydrolase